MGAEDQTRLNHFGTLLESPDPTSIALEDFAQAYAAWSTHQQTRAHRGLYAPISLQEFWYPRQDWSPSNPPDITDYPPIRDDYEALKSFLQKILDMGIILEPDRCRGDYRLEINASDYPAWLYQNNSSPAFRQNFERATGELLELELVLQQSRENHDTSPQFNRLLGLLRVIRTIGKTGHNSAEIFSALREKATSGFLREVPLFKPHDESHDIYRALLDALAAVQPPNDNLQEFWKEGLTAENMPPRLIAYIEGFLTMSPNPETRRNNIPEILSLLQTRESALDDSEILAQIAFAIRELCYDEKTFYYLDPQFKSLDFLTAIKTIPGHDHTFTFTRFTPTGKELLSAKFNHKDGITGDHAAELSPALKQYFGTWYWIRHCQTLG